MDSLQKKISISVTPLEVWKLIIGSDVKYTLTQREMWQRYTYIIMNRSTSKLMLAATTASPNRMNTKLRAT